jgi:hypothetical protein
MHYEADVLRIGSIIDVKVFDETLMHHFTIKPNGISYEVSRSSGSELIARPAAELQELQDDRILIKTATHYYEITRVPGANEKWQGYKSVRR